MMKSVPSEITASPSIFTLLILQARTPRAPTSGNDQTRYWVRSPYDVTIIGSVFFAVGLATFGTSFRKTPSEKAWEDYNSRKMPMPGHEFSWRLAPLVSREGAGLSFGGTF